MRRIAMLAVVIGAVQLSAAELKINGAYSKIDFVGAKAAGSHTGGFKEFTGTVSMPGDDFAAAKVTVEIDTNSLFTDTAKLTTHLKSADFFNVNDFPKATFTSTGIAPTKKAGMTHDVTGNLTLHGVTKPITVPVKATADASGVTMQGAFTLQREDFNMKFGKGTINNDVKVTLSIKAAK